MEKKVKLELNYLYHFTAKANNLKNELLSLQDMAEVTADLDDVQALSTALEELKQVVDTLPLA